MPLALLAIFTKKINFIGLFLALNWLIGESFFSPHILSKKGSDDMSEESLEAQAAIKQLRANKPNPNYRPLIFVVAPFSEVVKNQPATVKAVDNYCHYVYQLGGIPICPQLYFPQFINLHHYHNLQVMIFMCIVLLTKCEEVWSFGKVTHDMNFFNKKAHQKNITVRYFNDEMEVE